MAVYEVFNHPEVRRYKTHVCTKATYLMIAVLALTFLPPLFVVYRSGGFWQKEAYYREVPDVEFKKEFMLVVTLEGTNNFLTYSTYANYNKLMNSHVRIPLISSVEEDSNKDGKLEKLVFNAEVPVSDSEKITGVKLLLMFQYKLHKYSSLTMESMAYVEHESTSPGGELVVIGDLVTKQRQALGHKGTDTRFNTPIINSTSLFVDDYRFSNIFRKYQARNVTTMLDSAFKEWMVGRASSDPFKISVEINYPEGVFLYTPGFWYLIKWGWIQYASVLVLFIWLFSQVKIFIFQNQLVNTMVDPVCKHKTN